MVGGESAGGGLCAALCMKASIDIYDGMYHAFDMMEPNSDIGKEAIQKFEEHFEYAMNNYYAKQEN
ncbi:hypothetical protein SAMN04487928_10470 [Butyrivibrio proteoclasticus]|uniref:Alpha/beta hydrolase fold-3 domain-containing protein n=1 Tax=Butyrivibrio proteoclasticus TaxID=43305 RepID=A0A1I5RKX6_9FIRM|nr:hypothetical protein [Butyrivibrio proteoclasticus]SFP58987.1 hypothetical protein SAMN04487928_10470 [Butyrivibrio proteoclasticus]